MVFMVLIVIALLQVISINHESQFSTYIDLIQLYRRARNVPLRNRIRNVAFGTFRYAVAQPPLSE